MIIRAEVSPQTRRLIKKLHGYGLFGLTETEVAGRLIDRQLISMFESGLFVKLEDLSKKAKKHGTKKT